MGLMYRLNRYREDIVFVKNLLRHYLKYGIHFDKNYVNPEDKNITIPKKIHLCWFGRGEQNELIKKCINTWQQVLPEYEIVLWNEDTFPYEKYPFAKQALKDRKWAFVADVARLHALYNHGGIYMDTDMEVLKPLDKFLHHGFFSAWESENTISAGILGAKPKNKYVELLLSWYKDWTYGKDYYDTPNTRIITKISVLACGVKRDGKHLEFGDCCIYTSDYFYPEKVKQEWDVKENTHTIHHCDGSWGK